MRRRPGRVAMGGVVTALLLTGCGAGSPLTPPAVSSDPSSDPSSAVSPAPSGPPSASNNPRVPDDGVPLTQLGFTHGPAYFSVPRGAGIATGSDQEATVTLVLTSPVTSTLVDYYERALPATGFTVGARRVDAGSASLSFGGHGWDGVLTGTGNRTGITIRKAGS